MTRSNELPRNLLQEMKDGNITFARLVKERVIKLGGNARNLISDSKTDIKVQQLQHFIREDSAWLGIGDYDGVSKFAVVLKYDVDAFLDAYIDGYNLHHRFATKMLKSTDIETTEQTTDKRPIIGNSTAAPNLMPVKVVTFKTRELTSNNLNAVDDTYTEENIRRNLLGYRCSEIRKKHALTIQATSQKTGESTDVISAVLRASAPIEIAERLLAKLVKLDLDQPLTSAAD